MERVDLLIAQLELPIRDRALLAQALTHSSWLHEHPGEAPGHNERLEFLGDAVVNLAISESLFARHPDDDEGILSARRAAIVSTVGLARLADRLELGSILSLGEGESQRDGRRRPSLLASTFEAIAGAALIDLGWEAASRWIAAIAAPEIEAALPASALKSPKSRLQEHTQRTSGSRPLYRLLDAVGPDHEKVFRVEVLIDEEVLGMGTGPSRREAETGAAVEALDIIAARIAEARETVREVRQAPAAAAAPNGQDTRPRRGHRKEAG